MDEINAKVTFWRIFAVIVLTAIMAAAIRWSLDHHYPVHWDEAQYLNDVAIDAERLRAGLLLRLGGRILIKNWGHPPAYRLFAVPVLALFGFHPTTARLVSLLCFALSAAFIYLATRRIASQLAGAFAVLIFCLSPQVVSASIWFSTEGPLYVATSAMLYYLFMSWTDPSERSSKWIGLGLAVGLGLLSKTSFLLLSLPVLAFAVVAARCRHVGVSPLKSLCKAGALALLIAGPWWVFNSRSALEFARWSRSDARFSLGAPSLGTWIRWLSAVFQGLLGHGVSLVILLVALACLHKAIVSRAKILDPLQKIALGACVCAGLPLVLAQLSGTDHALRLISPVVIPLAIAVGVLADRSTWAGHTLAITVSSFLFLMQLAMIVAPVFYPNTRFVNSGVYNIGVLPWGVMARGDQWDWRTVYDISQNCSLDNPRISYLGEGTAFNAPQIEYPWAAIASATKSASVAFPEVTRLWQYDEGPIDWQKVMESVGQSDIVVTAPAYIGQSDYSGDLNNQHNAEFTDRLSKDPRVIGPIHIEMGRFQPVEVFLFVNKNLKCRSLARPQG